LIFLLENAFNLVQKLLVKIIQFQIEIDEVQVVEVSSIVQPIFLMFKDGIEDLEPDLHIEKLQINQTLSHLEGLLRIELLTL